MRYAGQLPVRLMPRLAQLAGDSREPVDVEVQVGRDAGYPALKGHVHGCLSLVCQRCDRLFDWMLDAQLNLRLVGSESEERGALQDCDPCLVVDDTLPLREVIEEEILLALPMLARCESCENSIKAAPKTARQQQPERQNPFAALKQKFEH